MTYPFLLRFLIDCPLDEEDQKIYESINGHISDPSSGARMLGTFMTKVARETTDDR